MHLTLLRLVRNNPAGEQYVRQSAFVQTKDEKFMPHPTMLQTVTLQEHSSKREIECLSGSHLRRQWPFQKRKCAEAGTCGALRT
jgi:hypothetical protein